MSEYINEGMYWNTFPSWVEESYPFMPAVFQTAENQVFQIQEGESFLQVLQKIGKRASETQASGKSVKSNDIATAVLRSQPPHPNDVPDMVDWYLKWGGGEGMHFVTDIALFCKEMKLSGLVRVSGRHFKVLADLKFGTQMPSHAIAVVVKRLAACEKPNDGIASSITLTDIAKFGLKLKNEFLEVDTSIKENVQMMVDEEVEP